MDTILRCKIFLSQVKRNIHGQARTILPHCGSLAYHSAPVPHASVLYTHRISMGYRNTSHGMAHAIHCRHAANHSPGGSHDDDHHHHTLPPRYADTSTPPDGRCHLPCPTLCQWAVPPVRRCPPVAATGV